MTASARTPVRRSHFATTDVEEGTAFLRAGYTQYEPELTGDRRDFAVDVASEAVDSSLGGIRFDRIQHSMTMSVAAEPFEQPVVAVRQGGRWELSWGHQSASSVALVPAWDRFRAESRDFDVLCATLDLPGVRAVAAALTDLDPAAVRFTAIAPTNPTRARALVEALDYARRDVLTSGAAVTSPLVLSSTFRYLAGMMLTAFPNTALDAMLDPTAAPVGDAEPATVRRAVEFIDTHARDDIDVTQIADAARVSPRALQAAFRRHRDQTPLEYLRRVRMDGAHRDLQAADPARGGTVPAIATRWGFSHLRRFSLEYRDAYGCPPSGTLHR